MHSRTFQPLAIAMVTTFLLPASGVGPEDDRVGIRPRSDESGLRQGRKTAVNLPPDPVPVEMFEEEEAQHDATSFTLPSLSLYLRSTNGNWIDQGPGPTRNAQVQNLSPNNEVSGAIHAVVAHPTDPDILYVGAVNGGIWRTMDATMASPTWTPLTDFEQSLSTGALEMDPGNPMILLAGVGRFSSFGGDPPFQVAGGDLSGLLRTTDGGNTWTPITDPLLVGEHISSVASRGNILLAGANNFFGGGGVGGLFRSIDTGASWTQISGGGGSGLPAGTVDDLAGDPANTSRLYGALQGNGVYRTDDTGATWTQVSNNDATLNAAMLGSTNTRIAVALDCRVFVLVTSGATVTYIGFSDDLGATWTQMDVPGTMETALRGRDELMGLVVDPSSSDLVYASAISQRGPFPNSVGATSFHAHIFRGDVTRPRGIVNNVSNQWDHLTHQAVAGGMPNGGTLSTSSPHADSREMTFDAMGDLIEVDDGGVVRRISPGNNLGDWFSINGDIQVTEFHSIAYDTNFDVIIGGTQDTGTPEQSAPGSTTWNTLAGADGGKVAVDDSVPGTSVRYFSSQFLGRFTRRTCNPACANAFPALTGANPAQFYTPLELNTFDPTRLLLGTRFGLSESMNQGNTASIVPGAAVTANSDARMVYGHANNAELIYIGAGTQVFVRTTAGGNLTATTAAFPGGRVFGVAVDPADEDVAYVIDNASVYQTDDGGGSWTNITGNITVDGAGSFRSIAYIPSATTDRLAVGTNAGVRSSFEGSLGTWFLMGTGLPNAPVWDLDYDAADKVLVAGTLGRGAWLIQLNAPPVAQCQPFFDFADGACCITVDVSDIDAGSFDPDGPADIDTICITEVDGIPVPCQSSVLVCDDGTLNPHTVTLTITDLAGESDSCDAVVTVIDNTPPEITCPADVTLTCGESIDPMETGMAMATDNCDPDPAVAFADVVTPTVCPADLVQEIIERTWTATDDSTNESGCVQEITVLKRVKELDIKPGSCPNSHNPGSQGNLPVSLIGTATFDVSTVNTSTLLLSRADCVGGAVAPIQIRFGDSATPFPGEPCDCHELTGDGGVDLKLKFSRPALASALGLDAFEHGDLVELVLSGELDDGCEFIAADCIRIVGSNH